MENGTWDNFMKINVGFIDLKQGILTTDTCENKGMGEIRTFDIKLNRKSSKRSVFIFRKHENLLEKIKEYKRKK